MDDALRAELQKLLKKHAAPIDPENLTIAEFCSLEGFSKSFFYKLPHKPKVTRLPGLAKLRISREAREEWHKLMARLAKDEAKTPAFKAKQAARIEQRREAGRKSAESPRHVSKQKRRRQGLRRARP